MQRDPLPDDDQRRALGMLMHDAFNFMRYASEKESQALAYALHNIPAEIYGWGLWSVSATRGRLKKFQAENYTHPYHGPDFVAIFNEIFPPPPDNAAIEIRRLRHPQTISPVGSHACSCYDQSWDNLS